jgi:hypothetical protein
LPTFARLFGCSEWIVLEVKKASKRYKLLEDCVTSEAQNRSESFGNCGLPQGGEDAAKLLLVQAALGTGRL